LPEQWELLKIYADNALVTDNLRGAEDYLWQAIEAAAQTGSLVKVALCLESLGDLYYKQAKFSDSESIYNDCLEKQITALGLEHPELAKTLHKISACQSFQNKLPQAEDSLKQALLIHMIAYGTNHPHTNWSITALQSLYSRQGKTFDLREISNWGNIPTAPAVVLEPEPLICRTCHRPYKGTQCTNCTQMRLAAVQHFHEELERLSVVCSNKDIRAGSVIAMGSIHMDVRMASRSDSFSDVRQVLGKSTKRLIPEGQALKPSDVEDAPR
jgi:hypothetical protein